MNLGTDAQDPQRSTLYAVEDEWWGDEPCYLGRDHPDFDLPADVDELSRLSADVVRRGGWLSDEPPVFVLDVPDDDDFPVSAWHETSTGVIHMHPRLLDWHTLLHELSHWIDSRDGHGPIFCANYVTLVRTQLGDDSADRLQCLMELDGLELDPWRLARVS